MTALRQRSAYTRLQPEQERQEEQDPRERPPVKAIALGVALLCIGLAFYAVCYLHWHGHTRGHIQEGAELGLAILGTLTFLPGAYCCGVALAAWRGVGGYTYADIPAVD